MTVQNIPNFFTHRAEWERFGLGGRVMRRLALVKIGDISTKDEWKKQKPKEVNGDTKVFAGTTKEDFEITVEGTEEADFVELLAILKLLEPVPGLGGGAVGAAKVPSGYTGGAVGAAPAPSSTPAASGTGAGSTVTGSGAASGSSAADKSATPNPGPRPPTVSIQYMPLAMNGITAVARAGLVGPIITDTCSIQYKIKFTPMDPPKPAGTGAMAAAAPGSEWTGGGAPAGGAADGKPSKNATEGGAGT